MPVVYNAPKPKLALRDLFAVATIVALALGWWMDRARLAKRLERVQENLDSYRTEAAHWYEHMDGAMPQ